MAIKGNLKKDQKLIAKQRYIALIGKALQHFDLTDEGRATVGMAFANALITKPRLESFEHERTGLTLFGGRVGSSATKIEFSKGRTVRDLVAITVRSGAVTQVRQAQTADGYIYIGSNTKEPVYVVGILYTPPVAEPVVEPEPETEVGGVTDNEQNE